MKIPDQSQVLAFGRHIISGAAGAVAYASLFHLFQNPADAANATQAINQIGHGFTEIIGGVGVLVPIGMGVIAAVKSSPIVQMLIGATALLRGKADASRLSTGDQKTLMEATLKLPKVVTIGTNDAAVAAATPPGIVLNKAPGS